MYIFLLISLIFPQLTFAQETTIVPTKTPNKEVLEMVQKKVKTMLEQNINTNSSTTPKSIIGTISQLDNTQITINSDKNEIKNISFNIDTVFIDSKKNKTKIENIKIGQGILAMGYLTEGDFEAKRIVLIDLKTIKNKNEIILGKIVDISQSSPIFVLIPTKNKDTQYQIKTDTKTEILDKDNNKLTIDKLKSGQKIIVVIQPDAKIAKTFYVSKIITLDTSNTQN